MLRGYFTKVILDTVRLIVHTNGLPNVAIACWCSFSLLDCDTGRARTLSVPMMISATFSPSQTRYTVNVAFFVTALVSQFVNLHSKWLGTVKRIGLWLEPSVLTSTLVLKLTAEGGGRIIRLPALLLMLVGLGYCGVNASHFLVVYVLFILWFWAWLHRGSNVLQGKDGNMIWRKK